MNNDSPQKALLVVFLVALVCSVLVSVASIMLKPIQLRNQLVEKSKNVISLTGLMDDTAALSGSAVLDAVNQLDIRVLDIAGGDFASDINAAEFDSRAASNDPDLSIKIPPELDVASLGRRSRYEIVYLVWDGDQLSRIILPIAGQGMWSTIRGYIALENDLNTIAAVSFYEQTETAGLGDQIERPDWQAQWQGRKIYDSQGVYRFRIGPGTITPDSPASAYQVDSLSGATVTSDAVTRIIAYWFGPNGYKPFLETFESRPPARTNLLETTGGAAL
jgi:Na+-transporting NADH:ubiquinone oxidoreductase subunit C